MDQKIILELIGIIAVLAGTIYLFFRWFTSSRNSQNDKLAQALGRLADYLENDVKHLENRLIKLESLPEMIGRIDERVKSAEEDIKELFSRTKK